MATFSILTAVMRRLPCAMWRCWFPS